MTAQLKTQVVSEGKTAASKVAIKKAAAVCPEGKLNWSEGTIQT